MRAKPPVDGLEHRADGDDDPVGRFVLDFRTRSNHLAELRARFGGWTESAGADDDAAYDLLVAVNEAVSNSAEHAYPPGVDGTVRVSADLEPDGTVVVVVSDDGRWRVPPAALSDRGRRLLLMRENVDQVVVERTSAGTTVRLCRSLRPPRPADAGVPTRRHGHEVLVEERESGVHVVVRGDVPEDTAATLRRSLLTVARGGSVPVVVDLAALGARNAGAVEAVFAVADAASAAGNRVVVLAQPGTPVWKALDASGVRHLADVVAVIG
ncbi:ATP-binding protein [Umezawaea sp. Da 62-37]|uniref:ATP-binding protein n=1 Tax=Umezawaea sp. Da 62-37 TaxID=3075927 RepID=UPI0028F6E81B|nr:ATP-binding protein [Umezawaea sp. Da 62-37]WNV89343.1 ATP-binding protein [Umezawaea sp. Da 62-37]